MPCAPQCTPIRTVTLNRFASRLLITLLGLTCCVFGVRATDPAERLAVGDFALTERSGRTVRNSDLRGKVWVASFAFTRCAFGCDQITKTMADLQKDFARYPGVLLVTITVDPEHDDPQELQRYAKFYGADADRWLFLTGPEKEIYGLLRDGFRVTAEQNPGEERTPGNEVKHDFRLVVVDRVGPIHGFYDCLGHRPPPRATR